MVVRSLVHDLSDLSIQRPLHLLLRRAIRVRTLVIASRVFASFDLLLPILPPVVSVVQLPLVFEGQRSLIGMPVIRLDRTAMAGLRVCLQSWDLERICSDWGNSFNLDVGSHGRQPGVVIAGIVVLPGLVAFQGSQSRQKAAGVCDGLEREIRGGSGSVSVLRSTSSRGDSQVQSLCRKSPCGRRCQDLFDNKRVAQ